MVSWPGVCLWQITLLCPVLCVIIQTWQRRSLPSLGRSLNLLAIACGIGLIVSGLASQVRPQSLWYGWSALGLLTVPFAIQPHVQSAADRLRVLRWQGYLGLAFILTSLSLWTTQTLFPTIATVRAWQALGLGDRLPKTSLEFQNWAPIGHQNYVAGYLILILPLFVGLGLCHKGWQRLFWLGAFALGLVNLYTTLSRGGWLALLVMAGIAIIFSSSQWSNWGQQDQRRRRLTIGITVALIMLAIVIGFVLTNARLRNSLQALLRGELPLDAFRQITIAAGLQLGLDFPLTGAGLGAVPLLYQRYRPVWAGQEAELVYQLHSTPAQLWAELGTLGIILLIAVLVWLVLQTRHWLRSPTQSVAQSDRYLTGSLLIACFAYTAISLVDFQLDNLCISATWGLYIATVAIANASGPNTFSFPSTATTPAAAELAKPAINPWARRSSLIGLGLACMLLVWLLPIQRAWQLAERGYLALADEEVPAFIAALDNAHQLVPWDPYYAYVLGATLADRSLQAPSPAEQQDYVAAATEWFEQGNRAAPDWEFGSSNLGWLQVNRDPLAAQALFQRSIQLLPAKAGVFYGLGISLLNQGETELAIDALSLEILRNPEWLTSPIWRSQALAPLQAQVLQRCRDRYGELLQQPQLAALKPQLRQNRGVLAWWQGDWAAARANWSALDNPLDTQLLALATEQAIPSFATEQLSSAERLLLAWQEPEQRLTALELGWQQATQTPPPEGLISTLSNSMDEAANFQQWLTQAVPPLPYRRERTGFGVLSRHSDGPIVQDLPVLFANPGAVLLNRFWLRDLRYAPAFDLALQTWRDRLLQSLPES
ncbi:MAG: O-antigen ligase family protein [Cyanobacteria bacterium P01_H01_bin.121]